MSPLMPSALTPNALMVLVADTVIGDEYLEEDVVGSFPLVV